jgi:hypothetical protein
MAMTSMRNVKALNDGPNQARMSLPQSPVKRLSCKSLVESFIICFAGSHYSVDHGDNSFLIPEYRLLCACTGMVEQSLIAQASQIPGELGANQVQHSSHIATLASRFQCARAALKNSGIEQPSSSFHIAVLVDLECIELFVDAPPVAICPSIGKIRLEAYFSCQVLIRVIREWVRRRWVAVRSLRLDRETSNRLEYRRSSMAERLHRWVRSAYRWTLFTRRNMAPLQGWGRSLMVRLLRISGRVLRAMESFIAGV